MATNKKKTQPKKLKIPKTVQDTIPYTKVYEDYDIIETDEGVFSKSYLISDINYLTASDNEQHLILDRFGELLNSFDSTMSFEITINNRNINKEEFIENILVKRQNDEMDPLRNEYNSILTRKMSEGKNNLVKEKYLTVSLEAPSADIASTAFARVDNDLAQLGARIANSKISIIRTKDRLEILHDIYNLGCEGEFGAKTTIKGKDIEKFSFTNMRRLGLTTKDCIGPMSFEFKNKNYFMIDDKYASTIFLKDLPSFLTDNFLSELTNTSFNMLTSIHFEPIAPDKALKIVKNQMVNINSNMIDRQKKASKSGYSTDLISPALKTAQEEAEALMQGLTSENQKLFLTTFVITVFADTLDELKENVESLKTTARKFCCTMSNLSFQQENGFTTSLPLALNKLAIKRTLTTESAVAYNPYASQQLTHKHGAYYGVNAISHNLIILDRRQGPNYNGFILGTSGSGKSFSTKREIFNILLNTQDDVIVIDPENEYGAMAKALNGEICKISLGSDVYINPFDLPDADAQIGNEDPITFKSDFILSICETVIGGKYGLAPTQRSIIDRCARGVYKKYLQSGCNPEYIPTFIDFQKILEAQPEREANELAVALEMYTSGSLDVFAHKSNVDINSRFVVFNILEIGQNLRTMGMLIMMDAIWNRILKNRKLGKRTWVYVDEAHLLFANETSANYLQMIYKRCRKYSGGVCCITQNVSDLLQSETARNMLSNSCFIEMLNQSALDRETLAPLLNISPAEMSYITNVSPGAGLLLFDSVTIPFVDNFPEETMMYKVMTTKPSDN